MLRVRDAMTRDVVTVESEESAARAWGLCRERSIRHLPVVEGGRLVGIVSDRDLRDLSPPRATADEENTLGWVRIRDTMSARVVTAHPLDTIEHAAKVIYENKFNCLPVVADDELVGIITSSDLVRTLVELTGAHGEGSWVEVEVPNEPGQLANGRLDAAPCGGGGRASPWRCLPRTGASSTPRARRNGRKHLSFTSCRGDPECGAGSNGGVGDHRHSGVPSSESSQAPQHHAGDPLEISGRKLPGSDPSDCLAGGGSGTS